MILDAGETCKTESHVDFHISDRRGSELMKAMEQIQYKHSCKDAK